MTVAVRHPIMSVEDFLAWEARQETKFEFDGFEPVAMAGGTREHAALQRNLAITIGGRLLGTRCSFYGSDLKLVAANRSRYPDGQVVCGGQERASTFTTTPAVVFEVASPGAAAKDHVEKSAEYERIASVQRYVILEQDRVEATVWFRRGTDWTRSTITAGGNLDLAPVGLTVSLDELYRDVLGVPR